MTQLDFVLEFPRDRLPEDEARILDLIEARRGQHNAISAPQLSRLVDIPDRQLRALVKGLIETRGLCICSSSKGFYVPADASEVLDCSNRLLSWAFSALNRARALRRTPELHRLCGQLELELAKVQREMEVANAC
jgi:hypothetical protein